MKRTTRITLLTVALSAGLGLAGASRAEAQVRFEGSFPVPHGRVSFGVGAPIVGAPIFSIGGWVPEDYAVSYDPVYGYGFVYGDQWISCRPYGSRWIVVEGRPFHGYRGYAYTRPGYGYLYGSPRVYGRHDDRRTFAREDRRFENDRRDRRGEGRRDRRDGREDRFDQGRIR